MKSRLQRWFSSVSKLLIALVLMGQASTCDTCLLVEVKNTPETFDCVAEPAKCNLDTECTFNINFPAFDQQETIAPGESKTLLLEGMFQESTLGLVVPFTFTASECVCTDTCSAILYTGGGKDDSPSISLTCALLTFGNELSSFPALDCEGSSCPIGDINCPPISS